MVFCNVQIDNLKIETIGHNPYFNRWFSAISNTFTAYDAVLVTILILIDGFLQ